MNVSMMDSYNLSWKLAHTLHGLSPQTLDGNSVLASFEHERLTVAKQLIEFDTKFSSMFSGSIGSEDSLDLTHEQFLKVFSDGSGFTSGCGIDYPIGLLVDSTETSENHPITGQAYLDGTLKCGRRLLDSLVRRYADATLRHLHDDFKSTGRYRILVFTATDLTTPNGMSARALDTICNAVLPTFPPSTIELVVVHPSKTRVFEWSDVPECVKKNAEMSFHGPVEGDLYGTYGVREGSGAVAVIRPDGYVGQIKALVDAGDIVAYLSKCLVRAQ
jgi:phenol 2-monooxygenase